MIKMLRDFSYRTDVTWDIYIICAAATILFAMVTVSCQAIKSAIANPVKSLRTE